MLSNERHDEITDLVNVWEQDQRRKVEYPVASAFDVFSSYLDELSLGEPHEVMLRVAREIGIDLQELRQWAEDLNESLKLEAQNAREGDEWEDRQLGR